MIGKSWTSKDQFLFGEKKILSIRWSNRLPRQSTGTDSKHHQQPDLCQNTINSLSSHLLYFFLFFLSLSLSSSPLLLAGCPSVSHTSYSLNPKQIGFRRGRKPSAWPSPLHLLRRNPVNRQHMAMGYGMDYGALQLMWSAGCSGTYTVTFRDTFPDGEMKLIGSVLTFTASTDQKGGELGVVVVGGWELGVRGGTVVSHS